MFVYGRENVCVNVHHSLLDDLYSLHVLYSLTSLQLTTQGKPERKMCSNQKPDALNIHVTSFLRYIMGVLVYWAQRTTHGFLPTQNNISCFHTHVLTATIVEQAKSKVPWLIKRLVPKDCIS